MNENDWKEWKNHVLSELKRNNAFHKAHDEKINSILTQLEVLKVKTAFYGSIGGLIVSVIFSVLVRQVF